jgi:hypothetical protein
MGRLAGDPYTVAEDEKTNDRTPASFMHDRSASVPPTLLL